MSWKWMILIPDEQTMKVRQNEQFITQRNREIEKLNEMMQPVLEMFSDLNVLILEQGTMLDRIDGIMETAVEDMQQGNAELKKANDHQKSGNKCFYWYLGVVFVLILIIGFIIIGKKRSGKNSSSSSGTVNTPTPTPVPTPLPTPVTNLILNMLS